MPTLLQDIRYALRQMRKAPGFTLTAVLILALGIGCTTTVFSIVNCVLLEPLPFHDAGRLVTLQEATRDLKEVAAVNYQHYVHWKNNAKSLEGMAIYIQDGFSVAKGHGHPRIVSGLKVSPDFFKVLDVRPVLGRNFLTTEAIQGHNHVLILSWGAWQRYFHGDADAVGKTLEIGGTPQTVVGVLPRGFRFPHVSAMVTSALRVKLRQYEIFQPLLPDPSEFGDHDFSVIARLRPGVTIAQAQSELGALEQGYYQAMGRQDAAHAWVQVQPLLHEVTLHARTGLWLALGAAGVVLLIGCINLASLQLARVVGREREMAVRAALGAGRGQILWVMLRENLLLALLGGALGVSLAFGGVRLFVNSAPADIPRLSSVHVSWPVLVAALGLSLVTALSFGLLPALRCLRVDPQAALQANTQRLVNAREGERVAGMLVAGEVACTLALLILSGLLLRSLSTVLTQHRNFDADHLTLARVDLDSPRYGSDKTRAAFMGKAMSALQRIPGVQSVALTSATPLTGNTWEDAIVRPDHPLRAGQQPIADMRWVSPSYLDTLRIPLMKGRKLAEADRSEPTNVLISEQTARAVWPTEDAVGRKFRAGGETYTVVGVVANARINSLRSTTNMVYVPYWDNPWWSATYVVRSPLPTKTLAPSIRQAIWSVDPEVAIPVLTSMNAQVGESVGAEKFQTWLLTGFGGVALLLAMLGIYGTLAYAVSRRRQEFGIRMALGSDRPALMLFVLRRAFAPIAIGVAGGIGMGVAATRWMQSLLYHTPPTDPAVIVFSAGAVLLAGLLATLLPARRAARVDPMQALREG